MTNHHFYILLHYDEEVEDRKFILYTLHCLRGKGKHPSLPSFHPQVKDLLPVLQLLETPEGGSDFYTSYVLLLWLSIIVYMPFNMMGFDATTMETNQQAGKTVVER